MISTRRQMVHRIVMFIIPTHCTLSLEGYEHILIPSVWIELASLPAGGGRCMFLKGFFYQSSLRGRWYRLYHCPALGPTFTWGTQKLGTAANGVLCIKIFSHSLASLLLFLW